MKLGHSETDERFSAHVSTLSYCKPQQFISSQYNNVRSTHDFSKFGQNQKRGRLFSLELEVLATGLLSVQSQKTLQKQAPGRQPVRPDVPIFPEYSLQRMAELVDAEDRGATQVIGVIKGTCLSMSKHQTC